PRTPCVFWIQVNSGLGGLRRSFAAYLNPVHHHKQQFTGAPHPSMRLAHRASREAPAGLSLDSQSQESTVVRGAAVLLALGTICPAHAETIRFVPTAGVPTFAVRPPVLRVKPGDVVESRTFSRPGDYYDSPGGAWPGEVGPFFIEGATTNDTLAVKLLRVRPNRDTAVSAVHPEGISAVAADTRTRLLNPPLPAR